jgi:hypothetical protein
MIETFAAAGIALYIAHHAGDYWVQTDEQARHKGDAGPEGRSNCLMHVLTYLLTQMLFLVPIELMGADFSAGGILLAMLVSGVTHYMADRREYGLMFKLARKLPGKANFLELGKPRGLQARVAWPLDPDETVPLDNPSLGTGAWALDQSWHLFWGVFVAAIIIAVV